VHEFSILIIDHLSKLTRRPSVIRIVHQSDQRVKLFSLTITIGKVKMVFVVYKTVFSFVMSVGW